MGGTEDFFYFSVFKGTEDNGFHVSKDKRRKGNGLVAQHLSMNG
jgi:hypothetical protein